MPFEGFLAILIKCLSPYTSFEEGDIPDMLETVIPLLLKARFFYRDIDAVQAMAAYDDIG